jgi:uncharacterized protein with HEPN domain
MGRDRVYLLDILVAARLAVDYIRTSSEQEFLRDVQLQDAVIRRIEIIGEAARRLSPETRETLPALPWTEIIGMRNFVIHEYDDVDFTVVWDTVQRDLPRLIAGLEPHVGSDER